MPTRAKRPCCKAGCAALVDTGYCAKHQRDYEQQRGSSASRGYGGVWQRLRAVVLAEEPLCRACRAEGRITAATDLDHIIAKARGGTDARANLQPLCHACHSTKTAREDGRWSA